MEDRYVNKVLYFASALSDVYKNEEDRESIGKLELREEELTEDFIAMLQAVHTLYRKITGDDADLIDFTHILNKLAMQHTMIPKTSVEDEV